MRITFAPITALFALALALVPVFAQLVERKDAAGRLRSVQRLRRPRWRHGQH